MSQSGRSAEIVRLLEVARKPRRHHRGHEHRGQPPRAEQATAAVLTHAGEEATVACKTHLADPDGARLARQRRSPTATSGTTREALEATIPGVRDYLAGWRAHVEELAALLEGVRAVYYVGRGPSLGAVCSAGLITKESTHRPSEGMSSAAFRHGPMEMLDDGVFVLVFAGEDRTRALNEALVADIRAAGARAFLVAEDADRPALRLPDGAEPRPARSWSFSRWRCSPSPSPPSTAGRPARSESGER